MPRMHLEYIATIHGSLHLQLSYNTFLSLSIMDKRVERNQASAPRMTKTNRRRRPARDSGRRAGKEFLRQTERTIKNRPKHFGQLGNEHHQSMHNSRAWRQSASCRLISASASSVFASARKTRIGCVFDGRTNPQPSGNWMRAPSTSTTG